eukprot:scaffold10306_cov40-Phaeocystis_antarctica.AAC.2
MTPKRSCGVRCVLCGRLRDGGAPRRVAPPAARGAQGRAAHLAAAAAHATRAPGGRSHPSLHDHVFHTVYCIHVSVASLAPLTPA